MMTLRKLAFAFLLAATSAIGQNAAQQLVFAGLRTAAMQGQFNAVATDAAGNRYLLLDQKDGVRVLKLDPTATTVLAQTLLGGPGDIGLALTLDPAGNIYLTGTTSGSTLAATPGAAIPNRTDASTNAFVAKLDPTLATQFITFTGGSRIATTGLAATADAVFVTGSLFAANLPVTPNAIQQAPITPNTQNGFVERFNASGTALVYATYLTGAGGNTTPTAIAADPADDAYIAGTTTASGFPTLAALVPNAVSSPSGFLTRLTPAGDGILFSTFIPGPGLTSLALAKSQLLASGTIALGQFPVDTIASPLAPLPYQTLLRLPLDGSSVLSATALTPGTQSTLTPATNGSVWLTIPTTLPALPTLADTGSAQVLRLTAANTIDQSARFGGVPNANTTYATSP